MNPNALDRTAAWLLNMNVQFLGEESAEPECKPRSNDELGQGEKVMPAPHFLSSRAGSELPSPLPGPDRPSLETPGLLWGWLRLRSTTEQGEVLGFPARRAVLQLRVWSLGAEKDLRSPRGAW